ncbi:MAG TPA: spore coat U domain-containing protein [Caulobacterales bacterium]|jgi:spore coat protein U-like protein|nr:spore coat U domain-containing protein [Caulobacterales bacterium]
MRAAILAFAFWALAAGPASACLGLGCTCAVSAQDAAFGTYDPFSVAPADTAGQVSITCQAQVAVFFSYDIKLSSGAGAYAARRMASGAETLAYQLYTDPARTLVWGDGGAGTTFISNAYTLSISLLSRTDDFPVYARAPALQNAKPGAYSDTITVTVTF